VSALFGFDDADDEPEELEVVGVELPLPEPEVEAFAGGAPSVGEDALAVAWNAAKVLFAVGLMAKTIPCSQ